MLESIPQPTRMPASLLAAADSRPYSKRQQLLQDLLKDSELLLKNRLEVRHLMSRELVIVPPTMPLGQMAALMQQRRVRHLPVCARSEELLGVISDGDLQGPPGATAQQLMRQAALTIAPTTPVSPAITYLINENVSCLPVVDNGRLCGLLSVTDLVLTLQCTLQLWPRLTQFAQQDTSWMRELSAIEASLDGDLTAEQLREHIRQAREALRQQIQHLINSFDLRVDALTGMNGRRALEEMLELLLAAKKRHEQPLSLALVAIDRFRLITENCGENVAKTLVRAVARLLRASVRASDFVSYYRDDAFAVAMISTDLEEAETFCHRLREAARNDSQLEMPLRISAAAVSPEPGEELSQLLKRCEAALP